MKYYSKTFLILIVILIEAFVIYHLIEKIIYPDYNVILIDIDTLRADHLGIYGYYRNTSPNIDKFASESIVFENAFGQAAWTLPSDTSLFTSEYPSSHGVNERSDKISEADITLVEVLKQNGYRTAAFTSDGDVGSQYGFSQGFDKFDESSHSFFDVVPLAINWLRNNSDKKFFLFLHSYDVHGPYDKPAPFQEFFDPNYTGFIDKLNLATCQQPECDAAKIKKFGNNFIYINRSEIVNLDLGDITNISVNKSGIFIINTNDFHLAMNSSDIVTLTQRDMDHIIAHYDGNILFADNFLGKFFDELDKMNLLNNTIVIITSNHGENLVDHVENGRFFAHEDLYDEILHVPLIIHHPKFGHNMIKNQAQLIDVMPTLLDFLHIKISNKLQGHSLLPLIENNVDVNPYVYAEFKPNVWYRSIRTLKWKLIDRFYSVELYNLENDKKEQINVVDKFPDIKNDLENRISLNILHQS